MNAPARIFPAATGFTAAGIVAVAPQHNIGEGDGHTDEPGEYV